MYGVPVVRCGQRGRWLVTEAQARVKLQRALASLGLTPDAIAASLESAGVRGKRDNPCDCPLAKWLREQGFVNPVVSAGGVKATVYDDEVEDDQDGIYVEITQTNARTAFVHRFDEGKYPALIATEGGS